MMSSKKAETPTKKQKWMAEFSDKLIALKPEMAGKIDWDTASYLYNQGANPEEAVKRVLDLKESKINLVEDLKKLALDLSADVATKQFSLILEQLDDTLIDLVVDKADIDEIAISMGDKVVDYLKENDVFESPPKEELSTLWKLIIQRLDDLQYTLDSKQMKSGEKEFVSTVLNAF